jgi:hypothetical protein
MLCFVWKCSTPNCDMMENFYVQIWDQYGTRIKNVVLFLLP